MHTSHIEIDGIDDFIHLMNGRVFHATTMENYTSIKKNSMLLPNTDGSRTSIFGNSNGYFRQRGYVSFFDYRYLSDPKVNQHLYKCIPTVILEKCGQMVVLVLNDKFLPELCSWENWKKEQAYSLKVVPRIETGYPNFVPLSNIEEVIVIKSGS